MAYYAAGTVIPSKLHLYMSESFKRDIFPFLDLPAEIRNQIYDYLFKEYLVQVRLAHQVPLREKLIDHGIVSQTQSTDGGNWAEGDMVEWETWQSDENKAPPNILQNGCQQSPPSIKGSQAKDQQKKSRSRRGNRRPKRGHERLCHEVVSPSRSTHMEATPDYFLPFDFLLSNRQIYNEALTIMYTKTAFRFCSQRALTRFLSSAPPQALEGVQALDLSHTIQGEPALSEHKNLKQASDQQWLTTCRQIRAKMRTLSRLRITLRINDLSLKLGLNAKWARSIFLLRGKGLERVDARLHHSSFSKMRLNKIARELENAMMTPDGVLAKAAEDEKLQADMAARNLEWATSLFAESW